MHPCTRLVVGVAALALASARGGAQAVSGIAEVDSAAVARAAWRRGQVALRSHDYATVNTELAHAAAAWPTQPDYVWGHVFGAALVGDEAAVKRALTNYVDLGLGRETTSDTLIARYLRRPAFEDLAARLEHNRSPMPRSHVVATLPDSTQWPEGTDFDPRSRTWYLTSVRHRTINAKTTGGIAHALWTSEMPGMGAVLAVRVDTARRVLWATTSGIPQMAGYVKADSEVAELLQVRMADGVIQRRWKLPVARGGHVLGDVAIGPAGDVWFSDSNEPVLYRLRANADTLEQFRSPLFRSLQGVAPTPDARVVYVADYSHGILRVDVPTGRITRVADAQSSTSLGCDGIVWHHGSIVAVQNGVSPARIMRFALDASGTRFKRAQVMDRNSTVADEPTIGTMVGDEFVYVANSQWEKHDDDGVPRAGVTLTAPVLLGVRIP